MNLLKMVGVAIVLSACVSEPPVQVSSEAKAAANRQYALCERSAIARLDDGVSDARTIASAVFTACSAEAYASAEIYASAMTPDARLEFLAGVPATFRQIALEGVLLARAAKRN